jgi:sec-independent protein translocase protein TatA
MPFGIELTDIILLALVALIIFGPARLPEIGHGLGKAISEFRKGTREMTDAFRGELNPTQQSKELPQAPTPINQALDKRKECPRCNASNPIEAKFCHRCGADFSSLS